jgi:hypothetical protein
MVQHQIFIYLCPTIVFAILKQKTEAYHSPRVSHNESVTTRRLDVSAFNLYRVRFF